MSGTATRGSKWTTAGAGDRLVVWSYGGGTQSAAIAVLVLRGELPRPERIVMADTSREASATWAYLAEVVGPALAEVGLAVEVAGDEPRQGEPGAGLVGDLPLVVDQLVGDEPIVVVAVALVGAADRGLRHREVVGGFPQQGRADELAQPRV